MGSGEAKKFRAQYGSAGRHGAAFWTEESDNVGMKLLKGMGWQDGQGLGKAGQGNTSLVKQFRKNDNAGIGGNAGTRDDAFRASQDLFAGVLARLNGGGDEEASSSGATAPSLGSAADSISGHLAKGQLSRRFTRGANGGIGIGMKDTANYGSAAMDEIFGRRKDAPEVAATSAEDTAQGAAMVPPEQKTSSESLTEYFARKRAAMGLGPSTTGAAAGSAPAQGFSLDDQAAFAEEQHAMAYSGRGGLGSGGGKGKGKGSSSGGGGGGGGAAFAPPQQLQPTESQSRLLGGGKKKAPKNAAFAPPPAQPASPRQSPRLAAAAAAGAVPPLALEDDAAVKAARKAAKKAALKSGATEAEAKAAAKAAGKAAKKPPAVEEPAAAEAEAKAAKKAKKAAKRAAEEAAAAPAAALPKRKADAKDETETKKQKKKPKKQKASC